MAKLTTYTAFDYRDIDLYSMTYDSAGAYFSNNLNQLYDGLVYEDALQVTSQGTNPKVSFFAGTNFSVSHVGTPDSDGWAPLSDESRLLGGTLTAYLNKYITDDTWPTNWAVTRFSVPLKSVETAAITPDTADDLKLFEQIMSGNDSVILSDEGNVISTFAGNDSILGGDSGDMIDGGTGIDTMVGGIGHDSYWIDNAKDVVVEDLYETEVNTGADRDEDLVVVSASSWTMTADQHIEVAIANGAIGSSIFQYSAPKADTAISITGNSFDNVLLGNAANNQLSGMDGDDILMGSAGNDKLFGGQGIDRLAGGVGNDDLDGGEGDDFFAFDIDYQIGFEGDEISADILKLTGGTDKIYGGSGTDTIWLGGASADYSFSRLSATDFKVTSLRSGEVAFFRDIEQLTFNATGEDDESLPIVSLSDLLGTMPSDFSDLLVAPDVDLPWYVDSLKGNDTIIGGGGADTLVGNLGDDMINGEGGANQLFGGAGNDTYGVDYTGFTGVSMGIVNSIRDSAGKDTLSVEFGVIDESGNPYINLRRTGINGLDFSIGIRDGLSGNSGLDGWLAKTTIANQYALNGASSSAVETLKLLIPGMTGDEFYPLNIAATFSQNGRVASGSAGSDFLLAFGGGSLLNGLAGDDIVQGSRLDTQEELDVYNQRFTTASTRATLDNVFSKSSAGLLAGDTLLGGAGNDDLNAYLGNDRLDGGIGDDVMSGWGGNDTYVIDSVWDEVIETWDNGSDTGGLDTIESSISYSLERWDFVENLTLTGKANLNATGNALDNTIVGNAGNNEMNGLGGSNRLVGGAGNDTYVVDYLGFDGTDAGLRNTIIDTSGIDTLEFYVDESTPSYNNFYFNIRRSGAMGADLQVGIRAQDSNDDPWFALSTVQDQYRFSGGKFNNAIDRFGGELTAEDGTLLNVDLNLALASGSTATRLLGSGTGDFMLGYGGQNQILGNAGNDWIFGSRLDTSEEVALYKTRHRLNDLTVDNAWSKALNGGLRGDSLIGGTGDDRLESYLGNDYLDGGTGDDEIRGREGADILIGGTGADTFVYVSRHESTSSAQDSIRDFVSGTDYLSFSGLETTGNVSVSFTGTSAESYGMWYSKSANFSMLYIDATGDGVADMEIKLLGVQQLRASDFV